MREDDKNKAGSQSPLFTQSQVIALYNSCFKATCNVFEKFIFTSSACLLSHEGILSVFLTSLSLQRHKSNFMLKYRKEKSKESVLRGW